MSRGAPHAQTYLLSRWVFLRLLGLTYLIAFGSLGSQILGLVGANGILPIADYLPRVRDLYGWEAYRYFPTVLWLSADDWVLRALSWGGTALAVLLIMGIAPRVVLWLLWASYLSLAIGGQAFLGFQWDVLLLETGLLACFFAPAGWWPTLATEAPPARWARWLLWWLLFRVMFLSGITKLASGDPTWANLTALTYHYETQPLPLWTGWYLHQLPAWLHRLSAAVMFVIEIGLPWLALVPGHWRRTRMVGCAGLVLLQLAIGGTGNYGFFTLLSIALCLAMLDDGVWARLFPYTLSEHARIVARPSSHTSSWRSTAGALVAMMLFLLGGLTFTREIVGTLERSGRASVDLTWSDPIVDWVDPFRSVNGYGLFRVMTRERPEIVLEASQDGQTWREWPQRWKPGPPDRRPELVAPHQPRLDWQLWFAALGPRDAEYWLTRWMERLLEADPRVTALTGPSPFGDQPPRLLRLAYYDYRFTTAEERAANGDWWHRERLQDLTGPVSLDTAR